LAAAPRRPTIVMMHQPPFDTGVLSTPDKKCIGWAE